MDEVIHISHHSLKTQVIKAQPCRVTFPTPGIGSGFLLSNLYSFTRLLPSVTIIGNFFLTSWFILLYSWCTQTNTRAQMHMCIHAHMRARTQTHTLYLGRLAYLLNNEKNEIFRLPYLFSDNSIVHWEYCVELYSVCLIYWASQVSSSIHCRVSLMFSLELSRSAAQQGKPAQWEKHSISD